MIIQHRADVKIKGQKDVKLYWTSNGFCDILNIENSNAHGEHYAKYYRNERY